VRAGIDVRPALSRKTGVGRYLRGLVPALVDQGVAVTAFSASFKERLDPESFPGATVVDRRIPSRLLSAAWNRLGSPSFELLAGAVDLTHSPTPLPVPTRSGARVVTVHDLFFLDDPSAGGGEPGRDWTPRLARALAAADAIVCVSAATAAAARERLGAPADRIHVVHHGLEPGWFAAVDPAEARARAERAGAAGRFVLAVGALEVRKNFPQLVAAFAAVLAAESDLTLVIAGPDGPDREAIERTAGRLGLGPRLRLAGYQDDLTLRALYRRAALLVMPSLDEGFGFPVLEAMAASCPVVASDKGALPEVTAGAALLTGVESDSIAHGIARVLAEPDLRAELVARGSARAAGFRWAAAARLTALAYHHAVERRSRR
jgi:glycosyltransferase involved in cell wall biosynthesis